MFKLFNRKQDKPSVLHGVLQQISTAVEHRQRKAADYLNSKTAHWSDRHIFIWFSLLTMVLGGGAVLVVWQSFHQPTRMVHIKTIRMPAHTLIAPAGLLEDGLLESALHNIRAFNRHQDSLEQSEKGKSRYDSIVQYRAGLLDSLAFIEKVYQQQLKTREDGKKK